MTLNNINWLYLYIEGNISSFKFFVIEGNRWKFFHDENFPIYDNWKGLITEQCTCGKRVFVLYQEMEKGLSWIHVNMN